jgi:two-component system, LytTR family, response regulator
MKALIVEDSRLARNELKQLLRKYDFINLCGEAGCPDEAIPIIEQENPDLLFLDIQLPGKTGFDLLEQLDYEPKVIFITAYADYALRSFEYTAVDYLLKPIEPERLDKALTKLSGSPQAENEYYLEKLKLSSRVFVRDNEDCHLICIEDVDYFESVRNYTQVHWLGRRVLICRSLIKIEERLPEDSFFKASRKHIVNINSIKNIVPWINGGYRLELKDNLFIEVSRRHSMRLKNVFGL